MPLPMHGQEKDEDEDREPPLDLSLSLSLGGNNPQLPQSPPPPSPTLNPTAPTRRRRQLLRPGKSETIPVLYPWATDRRAMIRSLKDLVANGIRKITGKLECSKCERESEIEYDLTEKFAEVQRFIMKNQWEMHHRAPAVWLAPRPRDCDGCEGIGCVKPVIEKKRAINWLFLFLGQMIGLCGIEQLKYYCKHTRNHKTGAKDRLVYIAYMSLCKQLHPSGPYDL